jgi:hypothetical protein
LPTCWHDPLSTPLPRHISCLLMPRLYASPLRLCDTVTVLATWKPRICQLMERVTVPYLL